MAITYFGNTGVDDDYWGLSAQRAYYGVFTCPGSGNQIVKELSAYLYGGTAANVRLAVYNSAGNSLICQGTAKVNCAQTSKTWQGHMDAGSITPNPATLIGGTAYVLIFNIDGIHYCRSDTDAGQTLLSPADPALTYYDDGFPADISIGGYTDYYDLCIRCGVEPAAGGGADTAKKRMSATHLLMPGFPMAILPD